MKIKDSIQRILKDMPVKILIGLVCILITILLCYLFSIIYIKLTDPIEIPERIIAIEQESFQEIQDGRLKNGALIHINQSADISMDDKLVSFDRSELYYNVQNNNGKAKVTGVYERQGDSFVAVY